MKNELKLYFLRSLESKETNRWENMYLPYSAVGKVSEWEQTGAEFCKVKRSKGKISLF